ncbi:MAG: abortive infection family protein [Acidobacteriota bacterium]|nr:abortive infection family protein [Acidobacteriota bacterium]
MDDLDQLFEHLTNKPKRPTHPMISDGTIVQFRNAVSSLVLREIDDAFGAAGIPLGKAESAQFQGQRRTRFMDYMASVDQTNAENVSRLLLALAHIMTTLSQQYRPSGAPDPLNPLIVNLRRDGFEWDEVGIAAATGALVSGAVAVTLELDLKGLHDRIRQAEKKVDSDPAGAIGDAKELLESVYRTVARHHGIAIDGAADVTEMFKAVRDVLVVVSPGVTEPEKANATIKRLLGNLSGLSGTIAELRNAYGSGHGKADGFVGLDRKHARLAVTTAGAIAAFVLECDPKPGVT